MAKYEKNPNNITMNTPRGDFAWPKLTEVDYGNEKFPKPNGQYTVGVILDRQNPGVAQFLAALDKQMEVAADEADKAFKAMAVAPRKALEAKGGIKADAPYKIIYDEVTEEDSGKVEFKASMQASGLRKKDNTKWVAKPALFDGKGLPLKAGIAVWSGSLGIVNFECEPYFIPGSGAFGLSRRLKGAQIIQLVSSGGGRSAASMGFSAQDDGFSSDDIEADIDPAGDGSASGDDGSDTDF